MCKILKQNKFHPYKIHLLQELNEDDFDRCLEFCELMMEKIDAEPDFVCNIVFFQTKQRFNLTVMSIDNCRF